MTQPKYYEWARNEEIRLASFVPRRVPEAINLPSYINRADLIKVRGNIGMVRELYNGLLSQGINYDLELPSSLPAVQRIRTIDTILSERRGTCLDLALLFCSVCLVNDLFPLLIVAGGHVYASFQADGRLQDAARHRPGFGDFTDGVLRDRDALERLLNDGLYFPVECTGFARSQAQLSNQSFPEGRGRDSRGTMTFELAIEAGRQQVTENAHPFEYALDIYTLQEAYNQRPSDEQPGHAGGTAIYGQGSQGFINQPTGPITQVIDPQVVKGDSINVGNSSGVTIERGTRTVNTGGGDYAEGNIDKRSGTFVSGDQFNMSGNFNGAVFNIKSTLTNVSQTIGAAPKGDPSIKQQLQTLIDQLNAELQHTPQAQQNDAEAVAELTSQLVACATSTQPNRSLLQITGEGLKQAAGVLRAARPQVLPLANSIVDLALKFVS